MAKIIEFKDVYKSYNNNSVIKSFNLTIESGEFITVVGSSGSGKTTLLKMINGLIKPDKGNIFVNGKDISKVNIYELRKQIGYVIQGIGLMPHMDVENNINYVPNLKSKNKKINRERAVRLLELVKLSSDFLNRYHFELSGGQQQRVGIARALANEPNILLMDEPFGALDEITRITMQDEIMKLHNNINMTVFFITHDIREALTLGTKILFLNKGEIVQFGTKEDLINNPATQYVVKFFENYINNR